MRHEWTPLVGLYNIFPGIKKLAETVAAPDVFFCKKCYDDVNNKQNSEAEKTPKNFL